jgi:hypothetical protein
MPGVIVIHEAKYRTRRASRLPQLEAGNTHRRSNDAVGSRKIPP